MQREYQGSNVSNSNYFLYSFIYFDKLRGWFFKRVCWPKYKHNQYHLRVNFWYTFYYLKCSMRIFVIANSLFITVASLLREQKEFMLTSADSNYLNLFYLHFLYAFYLDANKLAFVNDRTWIEKSSYHLNGWNSLDDCFYCPPSKMKCRRT